MRVIDAAVRSVRPGDLADVRELLDRDPVGNVFVLDRLERATTTGTLVPARLGGEMLLYAPGPRLEALCFAGGNLVPVGSSAEAIGAFATWLALRPRMCGSLVGEAQAVLALWDQLEPRWGEAREVRERQPLLAMSSPPNVEPDPAVRRVRAEELDLLFPAAVAMFTEEVGVSPVADGGGAYRARLRELIMSGRAFARIDHDGAGERKVIFKADIGYATRQVCQIQGVWVVPHLRGQHMSTGAVAAVVLAAQQDVAPVVSLYVNDFNHVARALYERVGFKQVSTFATVLL